MSTQNGKLSIVIVTWNCRQYAEECLTSIYQQIDPARTEVVVVDNASSDGTAQRIAEMFPSVNLIRSASNLGFAGANNLGIAECSGDYLCLINPDVKLHPGCLQQLQEYMEREPSVGIAGPQMIGPDGRVGRSTMRFPTLWNSLCRALALDALIKNSRVFGGYLMRDFKHDRIADVDILNGWFWIVRRSALEQVGGLDEHLFMYGDDMDWCRRFHLRGWRVVFFPHASAIHYGGGASANAPVACYVALQQANLQYWHKYHGPMSTVGYFFTTWLHQAVRILGYAFVYLSRPSERNIAGQKIKRSLASISWLSGGGSSRRNELA